MRNKRGRVSIKVTLMLCALMLLAGGTYTGSLAWFVDSTSQVKNTFTVGQINLKFELQDTAQQAMVLAADESTGNAPNTTVVPGYYLDLHDTTVTIKKGSEKCYLFVRVFENKGGLTGSITETDGSVRDAVFSDYMEYKVLVGNGNWTPISGEDIPANVYYRVVEKDETEDQKFKIIGDDPTTEINETDKVYVKPTVTSAMLKPIYESSDTTKFPTLSFSAYAVQYYSTNSQAFTPEQAWTILKANAENQDNTSTAPGTGGTAEGN